jgi:multidrug efflux pump subunit AcrA (membrane-fusion protein)
MAKASFPNNGRLRDGQFVRARVIWQSEPGILVPTTAVTRVAGNPFIYVAETGKAPSGESQQIARQRPVKLGAIQGNSYQVQSGLSPGDQIIVSGILNLSDGAPITIGQPQSQQSSNSQ